MYVPAVFLKREQFNPSITTVSILTEHGIENLREFKSRQVVQFPEGFP